jgi:hypothetical protein
MESLRVGVELEVVFHRLPAVPERAAGLFYFAPCFAGAFGTFEVGLG